MASSTASQTPRPITAFENPTQVRVRLTKRSGGESQASVVLKQKSNLNPSLKPRRPGRRRRAERRSTSPGPGAQQAVARRLRLFLRPGGAAEPATRGSGTDTAQSAAAAAAPARSVGKDWKLTGKRKAARTPRYLIRAATLMLGAVRVRAASAGGSREVAAAAVAPAVTCPGPQAPVRSAACQATGAAVRAAARGIPGRGARVTWRLVCESRMSSPRKRTLFRRGLTT